MMKPRGRLILGLSAALAANAGAASAKSLQPLKRAFPEIRWDEKSRVDADLDLDAAPDEAYLGKRGRKICVGVIVGKSAKILCFGIDSARQDSLCSGESIGLSPEYDSGGIAPTPERLKSWGCKGGAIDDGCRQKAADALDISVDELKQRESGRFKKSSCLVLSDGMCDPFRLSWSEGALIWSRN
jgi:hypothetical protein